MGESRRVRVTAVIMASGRGERLWPRSRAALPKQFVQLPAASWQSDRTLIRATVDRIRPLTPKENIFVVTGSEWAGLAREQLPEIPAENIIIEPAARNTAPCIALATSIIRWRYRGEDPVMAVLPADHGIRDEQAFRTALQAAIDVARWPFIADVASVSAGASPGVAGGYGSGMMECGMTERECRPSTEGWADVAVAADDAHGRGDAQGDAQAGAGARTGDDARARAPAEAGAGTGAAELLPYPLVTLGIWPTRPETGYGYLRIGRFLASLNGLFAYEAAEFTEKPDAVTAQHFVASGRYLWNSGMFIWRASAIWEAFRRYMPAVHAVFDGVDAVSFTSALAREYRQLPSVSIDYGIMEKARPIVTIPCNFGWDDVGSWPALERLLPADEHGNVIEAAKCIAVDSRNCIVGQDGNHGHGHGYGHGCAHGHGPAQVHGYAQPQVHAMGMRRRSRTRTGRRMHRRRPAGLRAGVRAGLRVGLRTRLRPGTRPACKFPPGLPSRLANLAARPPASSPCSALRT